MRMMSVVFISACALVMFGCGKDGKPLDPARTVFTFAPITLALSCPAHGALEEGAAYFSRAPGVFDPSGTPRECVDRSRMARDLTPLGIRLVDGKRTQMWAVVIRLRPSDATEMLHLTTNAEGRRIVVAVNKKVLRSATVYGAITGDELYLSATSQADAAQLAEHFLKRNRS
ncbi:hypothetical protein ACFPPA_01505 [Rhodanobacter ginsengisoli]|uniref:SecDF P1 head subdomain domain-containing protein n=1 Tax=Rhodanobacter ginsengisoli TaxID=418646 RepID=A0ABW0QNZ1_9GAMM